MPRDNPLAYFSDQEITPELLEAAVGQQVDPRELLSAGADAKIRVGRGMEPSQLDMMRRRLKQRGAFSNDASLAGEVLRRLIEVERTRALEEARQSAPAGSPSFFERLDRATGRKDLNEALRQE